jgi:DegV family protein with EDD domain
LALEAAKAAAEGKPMQEIVDMVNEMATRTYVFAALETLDFLRRSGRMNGAVAALGNALKIKPLLKMNRGEPTAERVRTHKRAVERLIDLVTELGPLQEISLVHTNAAQGAQNLYRQAKHLFPANGEPLSVDVTPVLGANIGPGVIGFTCVAASKEG